MAWAPLPELVLMAPLKLSYEAKTTRRVVDDGAVAWSAVDRPILAKAVAHLPFSG